MMTILDIRYWRLAVFTASACIATVLSGCAGEGDEPVPSPVEGEVAEVPVTITFGTAWEQDDATRVPPPGQEADPDKIRFCLINPIDYCLILIFCHRTEWGTVHPCYLNTGIRFF